MSWDVDLSAEVSDLFQEAALFGTAEEDTEGLHLEEDTPGARWLRERLWRPEKVQRQTVDRQAQRRAHYAANRDRLRAEARERMRERYTPEPGGRAKRLDADQVLTIRAILRTDPDATMGAVADHFGVSATTIHAIHHRRIWRHVP